MQTHVLRDRGSVVGPRDRQNELVARRRIVLRKPQARSRGEKLGLAGERNVNRLRFAPGLDREGRARTRYRYVSPERHRDKNRHLQVAERKLRTGRPTLQLRR